MTAGRLCSIHHLAFAVSRNLRKTGVASDCQSNKFETWTSPLWCLGFHNGAAAMIGVSPVASNITVGCWNAKGPELSNDMDNNKAGSTCQHCLGDNSGHDVQLYLFDLLVDTFDWHLIAFDLDALDGHLFVHEAFYIVLYTVASFKGCGPLKCDSCFSPSIALAISAPGHGFKVVKTFFLLTGRPRSLFVLFLDASELVVLLFIYWKLPSIQAAHFA